MNADRHSWEETFLVVGGLLIVAMVPPLGLVTILFALWLVYNGSGWVFPVLAGLVFGGLEYGIVQHMRAGGGLPAWDIQDAPRFIIRHIAATYVAYGLGRIAIAGYNRLRRT